MGLSAGTSRKSSHLAIKQGVQFSPTEIRSSSALPPPSTPRPPQHHALPPEAIMTNVPAIDQSKIITDEVTLFGIIGVVQLLWACSINREIRKFSRERDFAALTIYPGKRCATTRSPRAWPRSPPLDPSGPGNHCTWSN